MASKGDISKEGIQPVLPKRWTSIPFKEGLDKAGAFTKLKSKEYLEKGKYPVIDQGEKFISGFIENRDLIYQGELPIVIFGDHTRVVKYIDFEFAAGADGTKILKPFKALDDKFFYYYVRALNIPSFGYSRHYKVFDSIDLPIPPLAEQKRIVAKLDALFGHLETLKTKLDRIPELLKNFRQQVLTQAVTGKLTGIKSDLKWVELEKFTESSFYGPRFGKDSYTIDGIATVRTTDMTDNGDIEITKETPRVAVDPKRLNSFKVEKDDLLITRTGSIGKMAIYSGNEIVIPSAYLIRFRFKDNALTKFIYYCLTSPYGQKVMGLEATAITQPNLNAQKIKAIKIPLYSIEEQNNILLKIEELFSIAERIEAQYLSLKDKIDNLPQAILNKAFNGELVPQDPNDEPASVLLERIKGEKQGKTKQVSSKSNIEQLTE